MSVIRTSVLSGAALVVFAHGTLLFAQDLPSFSAVDSAQAARAHYANARTAVRAGNMKEAQRMLERAMRAWPTQPAYAAALASIAARNNDARTVLAALAQLTALQAGAELVGDSATVALSVRDSMVAAAYARLVHSIGTHAGSTLHHQLQDSTLFPEGVAVNSQTGTLYVTSIRHRTLVEITAEGVEREIIPRLHPATGAMLAVRADADGKHLWATMAGLPTMSGYTAADSSLAALVRVRISDGAIVDRWDLGANSRHVPGDLAIAPNGDVFISDSQTPVLFRLRSGSKRLESITHPYFRSLQGMAITIDGKALYVADYSHGLLHLELASGDIALLKHADTTSTLGLDGVVLYGSSLVAVQNGMFPPRIVRYELDATGTAITSARTLDRQPELADEPTNGVVIGQDFVYIANSQWEKYDGNGKRIESHTLRAPRLLRLPLGAARPPLW